MPWLPGRLDPRLPLRLRSLHLHCHCCHWLQQALLHEGEL